MKVAVIFNKKVVDAADVINVFGPQTKERYNPKTVERVATSLEKGGHNVKVIEGNINVVDELGYFMPRVIGGERPGMVFNMAYGIQGYSRYTHIPAMLEMLGVPYVGSGPEAHAIALDKVISAKDQFPLDASVPVVFYAQDTGFESIAKVVEELSLWVDHKMFVLEGGYQGWLKKGGPKAAGKIRTQIAYLPKPGPGEIVGDEFMNIVNGEPDGKLVLDVRTADETSAGKISWANNIPLDDLQSRLGELPKDKEIIVYCGTGMRAQMAYNVLQNAGLKSRFLNDKVAFIGEQPICCYKE